MRPRANLAALLALNAMAMAGRVIVVSDDAEPVARRAPPPQITKSTPTPNDKRLLEAATKRARQAQRQAKGMRHG